MHKQNSTREWRNKKFPTYIHNGRQCVITDAFVSEIELPYEFADFILSGRSVVGECNGSCILENHIQIRNGIELGQILNILTQFMLNFKSFHSPSLFYLLTVGVEVFVFHLITLRHTPQSVGLLWTRDQPVTETST
jgi:hypothetical protein